MSNTKTERYEVRFTITVDRPELRGPTYAPVAAGTKIPTVVTTTSHNQAVRLYDAILRGEEEYRSEYVTSVQVVARTKSGNIRQVRVYRTLERQETRKERDHAILAVHAARRGASFRSFIGWGIPCAA